MELELENIIAYATINKSLHFLLKNGQIVIKPEDCKEVKTLSLQAILRATLCRYKYGCPRSKEEIMTHNRELIKGIANGTRI